MPYATNGQISTEPQDGWVEITDEQYQAALEGMMDGRLVVVDGGFAVIEPPEPEATPAPEPLSSEQAFAVAQAALIAERDRRLQVIAASYTQTERETWSVQVEEARAFKTDNTAPTPMLQHLAAARGLTVDEMSDRVLSMNASFAAATGAIMAAATIMLGGDTIPDDYADDKWWV